MIENRTRFYAALREKAKSFGRAPKYRMNIRTAIEIITEASRASLYHGTTFHGAMQILRQGSLEASDKRLDDYDEDESGGYHNISLTRDPRLRYYQVDGDDKPGTGPIVFEIDQDRLRQNFRIRPFTYGGKGRAGSAGDETEEQVLTQKIPLSKCVVAVHLYSMPKGVRHVDPQDMNEFGFDEYSDSESKIKKGYNAAREEAYGRIAWMAREEGLRVVDHRTKKNPEIARGNVKRNIDQLKPR